MTIDSMKIARGVNSRITALLTAALAYSRAESSSSQEEALAAHEDFVSTLLDMPVEADQELVTFALARWAALMIKQLSENAGLEAESVIQHFALTYNATISDDN